MRKTTIIIVIFVLLVATIFISMNIEADDNIERTQQDDPAYTDDTSSYEPSLIPAVDKLGTWRQIITVEYIDGGSKDILSFLHDNKEIKAIEYKLYIDLEDVLPEDPYIVLTWTQIKVTMSGNNFYHASYFSPSFDSKVENKEGFILLFSKRVPVSYFEDLQNIPYGDIDISMEMTKKPYYSFDDTDLSNYYRIKKANRIEMTVHHEKDYDTNLQIIDEYEHYYYTRFLDSDSPWGQSFNLDTSTKIHSVEYVLSKDSNTYVLTKDADSPSTAEFNVYIIDTTNPSTPIPGRENYYYPDDPIRTEKITISDLTSTPSWREIKLSSPITLTSGNYAILLEPITDGYYHIHSDSRGGYLDDIVSAGIKGIHTYYSGMPDDNGMTSNKFNFDFAFRVWGEYI